MPPKRRQWYEPSIVPRADACEVDSGSDDPDPRFHCCAAELRPLAVPPSAQRDSAADGDTEEAPAAVPRFEWRVPVFVQRAVVIDIGGTGVRLLLLLTTWALAWLVMEAAGFPELAQPAQGGAVFDTAAVLVVSAVVGGTAAAAMRIPGIATILIASVVWTHIGPHTGYLTRGVPPEVNKFASLFAVAVIVTRAGLALNLRALVATWKPVVLLAIVPLCCEAVIHGVVARFAFSDVYDATGQIGSPWSWAMLQGFVATPIAPGVVVPGYLALRMARFGRPPGREGDRAGFVTCVDLLIGAVVLDAVVGLWAANFVAAIVGADPTAGSGPIALAAVLGPIQLLVGCVIGAVAGAIVHVSVTTWLAEAGIGKFADRDDAVPASSGSPSESRPSPLPDPVLETPEKERAAGARVAHSANLLIAAIAVAVVCGGDLARLPGGASIAVAAMAATFVNLSLAVDPPALASARAAAHHEPAAEGFAGVAEGDTAHVDTADGAAIAARDVALRSEDATAASVALVRMRVLGTNAWLWDAAAMPLLFALTGTTVDLAQLFDGAFFGRAIGPALAGVAARIVAATVIAFVGSDGTMVEALFAGIAWSGKGAVQAALARIGYTTLDAATFASAADIASATAAAETVRKSALLVTLLFAPFGCLVVSLLGPLMLRDGNAPPPTPMPEIGSSSPQASPQGPVNGGQGDAAGAPMAPAAVPLSPTVRSADDETAKPDSPHPPAD
eukprot:CAMPEP_0174836844 /NCGR_PEP_ID=MMETSP1114-20130205/6337_1 /TAXON_ID=312471 /ORGANISM="Neobodo designis, Strain CCAP 1951/1" /LENGTH=729 /DNA_ID=CAMNT_0016070863 /DNA_START=128 /DNA_END=2314 /DNA_ORIENTATION=+